jgi:hypothetical protein
VYYVVRKLIGFRVSNLFEGIMNRYFEQDDEIKGEFVQFIGPETEGFFEKENGLYLAMFEARIGALRVLI